MSSAAVLTVPTEVDGFDSLATLALDVDWSRTRATKKVRPRTGRSAYSLVRPAIDIHGNKLEPMLADPIFRKTQAAPGNKSL
jgi:starch phosphorylase